MNAETKPSNIGRPRSPIAKDKMHLNIDAEVALYWRMRFHDDFTNATKVGALSGLVNRLLREEMNREKQGERK